MDPINTDLISPTSLKKKAMNNQPKNPNFESHDPDNYPQDQGEIRNEGPSVTQLFKAGNKKTSLNPRAQQKDKEIYFLDEPSHDQSERTPDESQNDQLAKDQELLEEARLKWKPYIVAKAKFEKGRFAEEKQRNSEQGTEMEIEEERAHPEDYEDYEDDDSYLQLIEDLSGRNESSLIEAAQDGEEEELDVEESQVFKGSNGSIEEPPFQVIEEINEERFEFNGNEAYMIWNEDNEDQFLQCVDERIERNPGLNGNGSFKDSNANNEYSMIQDRENLMNEKITLNANESFQLFETLNNVNFNQWQKNEHEDNEITRVQFFGSDYQNSITENYTEA